jgi:hypothetical protein
VIAMIEHFPPLKRINVFRGWPTVPPFGAGLYESTVVLIRKY